MKNRADRKIDIMGIINVTDNSFYPGSRCLGAGGNPDLDGIIARAEGMIGDGATILDIGACSTRPGAAAVGKDEEWRRLAPVLEAIFHTFPSIKISIDTWWADVIAKACALLGEEAHERLIVNDISAGEDDPAMLPLVGRLGLRYIAMHKRGTPATMQSECNYDNVTAAVIDYFRAFASKASQAGISDWILDPGFGFAKTLEQNYELMKNLPRFGEEALPYSGLLVGISRKSMIYKLFDSTPEASLPETQVLNYAALQGGADILRVHDVKEAAHTVAIYRLLNKESR